MVDIEFEPRGSAQLTERDSIQIAPTPRNDCHSLYVALGSQLQLLGNTIQSLSFTAEPSRIMDLTEILQNSNDALSQNMGGVRGGVFSPRLCEMGLGVADVHPRNKNAARANGITQPRADVGPQPECLETNPKVLEAERIAESLNVPVILSRLDPSEGCSSAGLVAQADRVADSKKTPVTLAKLQGSEEGVSERLSQASKTVKRASIGSTGKATLVHSNSRHHPPASSMESIDGFFVLSDDPRVAMIQRFVLSVKFDLAIGLIVLANAVCIGIETTLHAQGEKEPLWINVLEWLFLLVYVMEIALRLAAFGRSIFSNAWVRFDALLVVCGVCNLITTVITEYLDASEHTLKTALQKVMIARLLRFARLARLVRLMVQFRVLWTLISGLLQSIWTIMWTFVIIMIVLYMFGVLALEVILADDSLPVDHPYNEAVSVYFHNFPNALLTLLQCFTLDSIGSIYRPIILHRPWLFFYFISFILIVSIALLNLITALMVQTSLEQAQQDKKAAAAWEAERRKSVIHELKEIFAELDTDKSGTLDVSELLASTGVVQEQLQFILNGQDLKYVFNLLDYDESGLLGIDEFCEGLLAIQEGKNMEIACVYKMCTELLKNARETRQVLSSRPVARFASLRSN